MAAEPVRSDRAQRQAYEQPCDQPEYREQFYPGLAIARRGRGSIEDDESRGGREQIVLILGFQRRHAKCQGLGGWTRVKRTRDERRRTCDESYCGCGEKRGTRGD